MNDVFISYSRRDKVFTQKLYEALTAVERKVWADWDSIPASSDWFAEIKQGIEETDSVLFVLSPEWIKSNECRKEMDYAVKMGKRLFPILYIPVEPKDVPPELAKINWVYMREDDDFDKAFQTLCSAMDTDLDWIKTHTRIQVRALEWEKKNRSASFALRGEDLTEGERFIAGGATKNPVPTQLQSEYILASRTDATRRQRQTLAGVTVALVISIALGIYAFVQQQEAVRQAKVALARQLAAQAQLINTNRGSNQLTASLLSIQSMKLYPNTNAASFLLNNNLAAQPVLTIDQGAPVENIILSPDGKHLASETSCKVTELLSDCVASVSLWDIKSGKEINHFTNEQGDIDGFAFNPDGSQVIYWGCDEKNENSDCLHSTISIVDAFSSEEVAQFSGGNQIVVSPDGKYIAALKCRKSDACLQDVTFIWDTATGNEVARLTDNFTNYAFSPDFKNFASVGCETDPCEKGFLRVRETVTGNILAQMDWLVTSFTIIRFSPNGKYLVAGLDPSTFIWEVSEWRLIANLDAPGAVDYAFSPDSQYTIPVTGTACSGCPTPMWETATGKEVFHSTETGAMFSPDGKYVASSLYVKPVRVWDITYGYEVLQMAHDGIFAPSIALSPDGKYVVLASDDGTARAWEILTGKEVSRMTHDGAVSAVAFSLDGRSVISAGDDGKIRVWRISATNEAWNVFHYSVDLSNFMSLIKDNQISFFACAKDVSDGNGYCDLINEIITLEISSGKEINRVRFDRPLKDDKPCVESDFTHMTSVIGAISPNGKYIASVECKKMPSNGVPTQAQIHIFEMTSGKEVSQIPSQSLNRNIAIAFSPNGSLLASWECTDVENFNCTKSLFRISRTSTGEEVARTDMDGTMPSIAFSPDGKYVLVSENRNATFDYILTLRDATNGNEIARITHSGYANAFFSPDADFIVFGGCEQACIQSSIRVWDISTSKVIVHVIKDIRMNPVALSPNGKFVAIIEDGLTVRVREVSTGKELSFMKQDGEVFHVAFSPDGKYVAAEACAGSDCFTSTKKVTRVWETATGNEVIQRNSEESGYNLFSFSSDSKYIIEAGHIWHWQPEDIVANACSVMPRNLTRAEWAQFIGDAMPYPEKQEDATCPNLPLEPEPTPTPTAMP